MKNNLLIYFINRIIFWLSSFIRDYFKGGGQFFLRLYQFTLFRLDRRTGFSANWRYFKVPLWREYSLGAYLLSIPIRSIKILGGLIVIIFVSLLFVFGELIYFAFPGYLLIKIL